MSPNDYSTDYPFNIDPFVGENNEMETNEELNEESNNVVPEEEQPVKKKFGGYGCKLLFIVIVYLIIVECKISILIDTGLKKFLLLIFLATIGYNLTDKVIGFENNVCGYLF